MKIRLLAFAIMLCTLAKAQYVTIPDANFVAWLNANGYSQCMNGNQMDTTCSNVVSATTVDCDGAAIQNFDGIQYFDALEVFICQGNQLNSLPPLPASLLELYAGNNSLDSLGELPAGLLLLDVSTNYMPSLPSNLPSSLLQLLVYQNDITTLPALPSTLIRLNCMMCQFTSLPELPQSLEWLTCNSNPINTLPSFPPGIKRVVINDLPISDVPALPDTLEVLTISSSLNLKCFPIVKHVHQLTIGNPFECMSYPTTADSYGSNFPLPLCGMYNENGCAAAPVNLSGQLYFEQNNNCSFDANETAAEGIKVELHSSGVMLGEQIAGAHGLGYNFVTGNGTYQLSLDTNNLPFTIVCPANGVYQQVLTANDSMATELNFGLRCKTGFDLTARSISTGQIFRPANNTEANIQAGDLANFYHASCAHGVAGTVTVTINGPAIYLAPASGATVPSNVSGNVVTWNVADFGTTNALTDFNIVVRTDTFAQIGQQVCFTVKVTPTVGDNDSSNNTLTYCFPIVNSYDPNDKTAYPSGDIDTAQEWLTYRVRFQNTGNAEAQHIYIMDTLGTDVDASTFQLLAYSHQPNVQIKESIVRFNFPNINLPDSFTSEPGSHGYVQYKVKLKENLPIGTTILNTAHIYFDFNPPVVTNTTTNTIAVVQDTTGVGIKQVKVLSINIYPNPAASQVTVTTSQAGHTIYMYTAQGQLLSSQAMQGTAATINIEALPSGIYYIEVSGTKGTARKKLVKL